MTIKFGMATAIFLLVLKIPKALSLTDYQSYSNIDHNLFDLSDDTVVTSISLKFNDDIKARLCDGRLCIKADGMEMLSAKNSDAASELNTIRTIVEERYFILERTFGSSSDPSAELKEDERRARRENQHNLRFADLNNYYSLIPTAKMTFSEAEEIIDEINKLKSIEIAHAMADGGYTISVDVHMPGDPGHKNPSSTAQGSQGYLANNNNGIHALDGWKWRGGTGTDAKIVPVDGNLNINHIELDNRLFYLYYNYAADMHDTLSNHGTAVTGILFADDDGVGVTGVVHDIFEINFRSAYRCFAFIFCGYLDGPYAINQLPDLPTGTVITMSLGYTAGPALNPPECGTSSQCNHVPYEFPSAGFAAIQARVADGLVVVISASNGYVNLDDPIYNDLFNMSYRDSGAIFVGASHPDEVNGKLDFSNYGSRVTAHSWGSNVATIAAHSPPWDNNYTATFGGTSAAAPIVAGAAASIQSIALAMGRDPLTSVEMRDLISSTGTPQTYDTSRNIGVTPNIDAAAKALQAERLECSFGSGTATSGFWVASGMEVKNVSGGILSHWTVYLDFQGNPPVVTSITGGTATVVGDRVMVQGGPLSTGESASFSAYGTYTGPGYITFSCF